MSQVHLNKNFIGNSLNTSITNIKIKPFQKGRKGKEIEERKIFQNVDKFFCF